MLSFVNAHLEAYDHNIPRRNAQYQRILSSLVFNSTDPLTTSQQIFDTSHLFFMGDLNYRLSKQPPPGALQENNMFGNVLELEKSRMGMLDTDTLRQEQREGRAFGGLREGDLTRFAPTYKRIVGQVEGYSKYVDRITFLTRKAHFVPTGSAFPAGLTVFSLPLIPILRISFLLKRLWTRCPLTWQTQPLFSISTPQSSLSFLITSLSMRSCLYRKFLTKRPLLTSHQRFLLHLHLTIQDLCPLSARFF